jgi:hypothetical protein
MPQHRNRATTNRKKLAMTASSTSRFIPEQFNKVGSTPMRMVCRNFRPLRKNTLVGFAEIHVAELDLTMKDVAIHEKNGSRWSAPPARPQLSKDGAAIQDEAGKVQYASILEFGPAPAATGSHNRLSTLF